MYIYISIFHHSGKQVIQRASLLPFREPGPKARRVGRRIAGERALSRAQMVQQPSVYKFFDIMEKVLLEQG